MATAPAVSKSSCIRHHNLFVGDKVTLAGAGRCSGRSNHTMRNLIHTHTITHVDPTGYKFTCAGATAGKCNCR